MATWSGLSNAGAERLKVSSLNFQVGDAVHLELEPIYDTVSIMGMLTYLVDDGEFAQALDAATGALKPGGYLVLKDSVRRFAAAGLDYASDLAPWLGDAGWALLIVAAWALGTYQYLGLGIPDIMRSFQEPMSLQDPLGKFFFVLPIDGSGNTITNSGTASGGVFGNSALGAVNTITNSETATGGQFGVCA